MFSKACEYAIKAMIVVYSECEIKEKKIVGVKEVSKRMQTSIPMLSRILQDLGKKKIIQSTKGPNGGFSIPKHKELVTVEEIILAIDGNDIFSRCALGLNECSEDAPCPLHEQFKHIRENLIFLCRHTTIKYLASVIDSNNNINIY